MSTPPSPARPAGRVATALLWDLDNVCVPLADMNSFARVLGDLVEPGEPKVAAAGWRAFHLYRDAVRAHGIRVLCAARHPEGADGVLLRQARRLRKQGVGRLLIASNDRIFARLAASAELHVVTVTGDLVSRRLLAVARSVTVVTRDGEGWRAGPRAA